jgi:hypothetical protein
LQSDQQSWNNWAALNWTKPTRLFQRAFWNFNWWQFWTTNGLATERAFNTNAHITFNNQWQLHFGGTLAGVGGVSCDCGARGGPAWRRSQWIYPWIGVVGDQRNAIQPMVFFNYAKGDDGHSTSFSVQPEIDLRVSSRFRGSISLNTLHSINDMLDLRARGTHYPFAHIDQQQVSMVYRVDYTVTPTLTVQAYAQPFVSKARWSNLRELSATPRADAYADRLQPYADALPLDFNQKFFNSNVVVRWEYRPGSTLFVVWNQGRADFEDAMGNRKISGDFGRLFDAYPSNTFLIKASYWLNVQ